MPGVSRATPNVRLSLGDRLLLGIGEAAGPVVIHYGLVLAGPLDEGALRSAWDQLPLDYPILATRVRRTPLGHRRHLVPDPALPLDVQADHSAEREARFMQAPWNLANDAPARLLVQHEAGRARLMLAMAHVATDALGSFLLLDRLAERYARALAGEPSPAPLNEVSHRHARKLVRGVHRGVLKESLAAARFATGLHGRTWATFMDGPLPQPQGTFHWQSHTWEPADVEALRAWGRARGHSLNELLVASLLAAGGTTWPQPAAPVLVRLPVNMRDQPTGVANVVSELTLELAPSSLDGFEAALSAITAARSPLSARERGLATLLANAPLGSLPPVAFRLALRQLLAARRNPLMTLGFSNVGDLGERPRDFGPSAVERAFFVGQVTAPPGVFAWLATCRGRMTLVIGHREPAVRPRSASDFLAGVVGQLAVLRTPAGGRA